MILGIDASRNRSGGAQGHLVGILGCGDPTRHGFDSVHVWSYPRLLESLPERPWLVKHSPSALGRSLPHQLWWQYSRLPVEAAAAGCDIVLNTDAGTICPFRPAVTMSRDMLSYEAGEIRRFGLSVAALRLLALRYVQARSLRRADGAIFLTRYAADVIQQVTGPLDNVAIVPHGVSDAFRNGAAAAARSDDGTMRVLYVSNIELYKHQWHVVRAIAELRRRGLRLTLTLAGGEGTERARALLERELAVSDPSGEFVRLEGPVTHAQIPGLLGQADLFVFASSCENMPNTLVEAMANGLPIACSDRGPMPEVLGDAGVYFDPEDSASIATAVERLYADPALRLAVASRATELAARYSWGRCAEETWSFLRSTLERSRRASA